jgi:hypothetical protein
MNARMASLLGSKCCRECAGVCVCSPLALLGSPSRNDADKRLLALMAPGVCVCLPADSGVAMDRGVCDCVCRCVCAYGDLVGVVYADETDGSCCCGGNCCVYVIILLVCACCLPVDCLLLLLLLVRELLVRVFVCGMPRSKASYVNRTFAFACMFSSPSPSLSESSSRRLRANMSPSPSSPQPPRLRRVCVCARTDLTAAFAYTLGSNGGGGGGGGDSARVCAEIMLGMCV